MNTRINFKVLLLIGGFLISSIVWNPVLAQIAPTGGPSIKINKPLDSSAVPAGQLTIYGISSDNDTTNCMVYADWNDLKPMQNVTPHGPKGNSDYSNWTFTYSSSYHNIVGGPNELTSKITCLDQSEHATSKSYSINVTGTAGGNETSGSNVQQSNENTAQHDANIMPVKNKDSNVQQSNENTAQHDSNIIPVKNKDNNGTHKILPLYSESNDASIHPIASEDTANTKEVTSTDINESQDTANTKEVTSTDTTTAFDTNDSNQITSTDSFGSQSTDSTDKSLNTDTNAYQPLESWDENSGLIGNDDNTKNNNTYSDNSLPKYYHHNGNAIFELNFKKLDEGIKNKLEDRMQKLKERVTERMSLFDLID